jgi:hypothetical protein
MISVLHLFPLVYKHTRQKPKHDLFFQSLPFQFNSSMTVGYATIINILLFMEYFADMTASCRNAQHS